MKKRNPDKEKKRHAKSKSGLRSALRTDGDVTEVGKRKHGRRKRKKKSAADRSEEAREGERTSAPVKNAGGKRRNERAEHRRSGKQERRTANATEQGKTSRAAHITRESKGDATVILATLRSDTINAKRQRKYGDVFALIERWCKGEALSKLAQEAAFTAPTMKARFIKALGNEARFMRLKKAGAGGKAFGGKRGRKSIAEIQSSDVDAPRIKSARMSDGWKTEHIYEPRVVTVKEGGLQKTIAWRECIATIHVAPDGKRYVTAEATEKADAIYTGTKKHGLPPVRLRLYEASRVSELVAKRQRVHAHADAQQEVKKEKRKKMTEAEQMADLEKQRAVVRGDKKEKKGKKLLKDARKDSFDLTLKRRKHDERRNGKKKKRKAA